MVIHLRVKVAKLVQDKQPKPIDVTDNLGLLYDKYGNCVPHSILGTVEDFLQESIANGRSIVKNCFFIFSSFSCQ